MKPQLLKVESSPIHSFSVRRDLIPHKNNLWHYHSELEMIHFEEGTGTQFVGDNIRRFKKGDVVLLGANLPHYWRFDEPYFNDGASKPDVRVAHFNQDFWGNTFLELPENRGIKDLLQKARLGIQLKGKSKIFIAKQLEKMIHNDASSRLILLLEALLFLSSTDEYSFLSNIEYNLNIEDKERDRINKVYNFTLINFKQKISLDEISELAGISSNSFCRFFKSRTGKTYSRFLIEIRIGHACKLLIDNEMSVKELCYESGFNNFASFHKYFKEITQKSPLAYRREYLKS